MQLNFKAFIHCISILIHFVLDKHFLQSSFKNGFDRNGLLIFNTLIYL